MTNYMHDTGCCQDRLLVSITWCRETSAYRVVGWWEADQLELFETAMPGPAEAHLAQTAATAIMIARSIHVKWLDRLTRVALRR